MKDKQPNCLNSIIGNQHRRFIEGGHTCFDVFCLASSVCRLTLPDEPLCIWTQDKTLIAAAILAAVYGGPRIIIPYAFSPQALDEARACVSFSKILSGAKDALPADCTVIGPDNVKSDSPLVLSGFVSDTPRIWLFTGGSTGKPKLWSKTARNLFGEALLLAKTFAIGPNDCILSSVPPQHIYGLLFSVLVPLVSGCTVIEPVFSFPHEILSAARDMGATIMVSVPSQYHVLKSENLKRYNLRLAFSSAGMLPVSDAEYFYGRTGIAINDIYGSTETGGIAWKAAPIDRQMYHAFKGIDWKIHKGRFQLS